MHSAFKYADTLTNITEICQVIGDHFSKQISPYGYRFNCDVKDNLLATRTKSRVFVPVFFETALLALKMSDIRTCKATASYFNYNVRMEYLFLFVMYGAGCNFVCGRARFYKSAYRNYEMGIQRNLRSRQ